MLLSDQTWLAISRSTHFSQCAPSIHHRIPATSYTFKHQSNRCRPANHHWLLTIGLANLRITNKTETESENELASQKHGSGSNETKMPQQRTWTDMNQQSHYKQHISMSHRKKLNNGYIDQIKFIFFISICDKLKEKNTLLNNGHRHANSANI
jgi:hypothetical protein